MYAATIALALASSPTPADPLVIECQPSTVQVEARKISDFYRVAPANPGKLAEDAWTFGIISLVVDPPKSWHFDFDKGELTFPGSNFAAPLKIDLLTETELGAQSQMVNGVHQVTVNRITGKGTVLMLGDPTAWNDAFGTQLPPVRVWDVDCHAMSRRF